MFAEDNFEERLSGAFSASERVTVPPLTPERMATLRALVRPMYEDQPVLSLLWRRIADGAGEVLETVRMAGLTNLASPAPVFRGENAGQPQVGVMSLPVQGGELRVEIIPGKSRTARLLLTAKGDFAERDDLSVELSLGDRLLEARPLEQKAELAVAGIGAFTLSLYVGEEIAASLVLDIGTAKDEDDA